MKSKETDFLHEIDSLINEISILDKGTAQNISESENPEEEKFLNIVENQLRKTVKKIDSKVHLRVSEDKMKLSIDYYPARFGGKPLTKLTVINALNEENITDHLGLKWKNIEQSVYIVNSTEHPIMNEEISSGIPPINRIPAHIVLKKDLLQQNIPKTGNDSVDFKTYSAFIIVEKGQELGELIPEKKGFDGFDIYENKIPFLTEKTESLKVEKNIEIVDNKLISQIDGSLKIDKGTVSVEKILLVPGNVDYNTGNIKFKGDIKIKGFIQDDFEVLCQGKILCENNIYGASVRCSESMEITGGILGKNKGKIVCGGNLSVKFIENALISCTKNMFISKEVVNSNIFCSGQIKTGPKGIIVGSQIFAQNGIETNQMGNRAETPVHIYLGLDFVIQKKLEKLNKVQTELAQKEVTLTAFLSSDNREEEKERKRVEFNTILEYRKKVIRLMNHLLNNLEQNDKAKLIVRGDIFPGVNIEICHICYKVTKKLSNIYFYLNKASGNIEYKKN